MDLGIAKPSKQYEERERQQWTPSTSYSNKTGAGVSEALLQKTDLSRLPAPVYPGECDKGPASQKLFSSGLSGIQLGRRSVVNPSLP